MSHDIVTLLCTQVMTRPMTCASAQVMSHDHVAPHCTQAAPHPMTSPRTHVVTHGHVRRPTVWRWCAPPLFILGRDHGTIQLCATTAMGLDQRHLAAAGHLGVPTGPSHIGTRFLVRDKLDVEHSLPRQLLVPEVLAVDRAQAERLGELPCWNLQAVHDTGRHKVVRRSGVGDCAQLLTLHDDVEVQVRGTRREGGNEGECQACICIGHPLAPILHQPADPTPTTTSRG
jgi:hypothetical protein